MIVCLSYFGFHLISGLPVMMYHVWCSNWARHTNLFYFLGQLSNLLSGNRITIWWVWLLPIYFLNANIVRIFGDAISWIIVVVVIYVKFSNSLFAFYIAHFLLKKRREKKCTLTYDNKDSMTGWQNTFVGKVN